MRISGFRVFQLTIIALYLLSCFSTAVDEFALRDSFCGVINEIGDVLEKVAPVLVLLMFTYGGVKYVFSADDPGGRKQGKMICIYSIIGGILIILTWEMIKLIFGSLPQNFRCPTTPWMSNL